MGLFSNLFGQSSIDTPSWQGSTQTPTTQKQTLNWKPQQVQPYQQQGLNWNPYQVQQAQPLQTNWQPYQPQATQSLAMNWQPYQPQMIQSQWNPMQETPYSGLEQSAISSLSRLLQYGGYSPEQKQTMYQGMMAPVYQEAEEARRQAEADAYRRGLGQSGVLSRSYGDIDKQLLAAAQQARGQIEAQSAAQVAPTQLAAVQGIQAGQQPLQQLMAAAAEAEAGRGMTREQLATQLSMTAGDLQTQLLRAEADREVSMQQMATQLNMTQGQLENAMAQAEMGNQTALQQLAAQVQMHSGDIATTLARMEADQSLAREQLAAQLNMHQGDLEVAISQINSTLAMSDADRQVELQRIMNQFNLDATSMQILQNEAKKDRWSSFFANLLGGGATVLGGYLGIKGPNA